MTQLYDLFKEMNILDQQIKKADKNYANAEMEVQNGYSENWIAEEALEHLSRLLRDKDTLQSRIENYYIKLKQGDFCPMKYNVESLLKKS